MKRSMVAHVGVNLVGKVDGCRSLGKRNNLALRGRQDVNAVGEEVDFDVFKKLCAVRAGALIGGSWSTAFFISRRPLRCCCRANERECRFGRYAAFPSEPVS